MPITIHDLAVHRGARSDENERFSGAEYVRVGLAIFGGCAGCGANLASYNAYPSKRGVWLCHDCIGDNGWDDVAQANADIFHGDEPAPADELRNLPHGVPDLDGAEMLNAGAETGKVHVAVTLNPAAFERRPAPPVMPGQPASFEFDLVDEGHDDLAMCEMVFAICNSAPGELFCSPDQAETVKRYRDQEHRSLSVGDSVALTNHGTTRRYTVAGFGFDAATD